jgi:uncharacterized protein (TIGR02118 family)
MALSLQVLYPTDGGTTFDHDYFAGRHMKIIDDHIGRHIESRILARKPAPAPDQPAQYHMINTLTFRDKAKMDAALAAAGPVISDIANFYNGKPVMLFGEVLG